ISRSANAGPTLAARSGRTSKAGLITSGPQSSAAMSARNSRRRCRPPTRPEGFRMPPAVPSLQTDAAPDFRKVWRAAGFSDLFIPLDDLLVRGGDGRLALDGFRVNEYGCGPFPSPDIWCFASSTASPISEAAYERVGLAREKLMRAAIAVGF